MRLPIASGCAGSGLRPAAARRARPGHRGAAGAAHVRCGRGRSRCGRGDLAVEPAGPGQRWRRRLGPGRHLGQRRAAGRDRVTVRCRSLDGDSTVVMPIVRPSGSAGRPSGATPADPPSSEFQSRSVAEMGAAHTSSPRLSKDSPIPSDADIDNVDEPIGEPANSSTESSPGARSEPDTAFGRDAGGAGDRSHTGSASTAAVAGAAAGVLGATVASRATDDAVRADAPDPVRRRHARRAGRLRPPRLQWPVRGTRCRPRGPPGRSAGRVAPGPEHRTTRPTPSRPIGTPTRARPWTPAARRRTAPPLLR